MGQLRSVKLKPGSEESTGTNDKREQILQGAMQVFLKHGYAGTSMDRVAATAGVSKQTIYSHFQDKDGLFTALIERVTIHRLQHELGATELRGEPAVLLRQLGQVFLTKMGSQEYLSLLRVVIAESVRFPELAQLYSRTVVHRGRQLLSTYFEEHPELNIADPEATAHIFAGSLVSLLISQELLYGKAVSPLEGERVVDALVTLVLGRST